MSARLERFRHTSAYLLALTTLDPDRRLTRTGPIPGGAVGLLRCQRLLDRLGNPERRLNFVHITGTSGKGSTTTFIHAIAHSAGLRVGSVLSPHLTTPLERIALNGGLLEPEAWIEGVDRLKPFLEAEYEEGPYGIPLYQEVIFALALRAFVDRGIDLAVIEVGIGGALDSTNVIPAPRVAIVTDVGLDHTELLGPDVRSIARDKGGIFKPGCIALTAARHTDAIEEIEIRARAEGVSLYHLDTDCHVLETLEGATLEGPFGRIDGLRPGLQGIHQMRNAALASLTAQCLRRDGWTISDEAIREGVATAFLPGRLETLSVPGGDLLLDIAHNVDKIGALVETWLERYGRSGAVVVAVAGDKDQDGMLEKLAQAFPVLIATRPLDTHRPMASPRKMAQQARAHGMEAYVMLDPTDAVARALVLGRGRATVTGSTYLVGEVRARYQSEADILAQGAVRPVLRT